MAVHLQKHHILKCLVGPWRRRTMSNRMVRELLPPSGVYSNSSKELEGTDREDIGPAGG